jgi:hypothetical protein
MKETLLKMSILQKCGTGQSLKLLLTVIAEPCSDHENAPQNRSSGTILRIVLICAVLHENRA